MKFAMGFEVQLANPTVEREHQLIHQCVEQAVFAEEMGFDRVWAVEHHGLKWYAHMSAPEVFLTWVAAKTNRIRVGHGVPRGVQLGKRRDRIARPLRPIASPRVSGYPSDREGGRAMGSRT